MSINADETHQKLGEEIEVQDIVVFLGTPHRITRITPYTHPVVTQGEPGWRIAHAGPGQESWGITLCPGQLYEVL